jgi:hypothetical protein
MGDVVVYDIKVTDCGVVGLWRSSLREVCVVVEGPYAALSPARAREVAVGLSKLADAIEAEVGVEEEV